MTERKWTPGPWVISKISETSVTTPNRRGICSTGGYSVNLEFEKIGIENAANACLIAAAPELYEALDTLVGTYRKLYEDTQPVDDLDCDKPFAKATEALAKARGET